MTLSQKSSSLEGPRRVSIVRLIEQAHARLGAQGLEYLRTRCGLSMRQWWIIVDMAEGTPKTPTDLARIGEVDKGLLSRNLKALIGCGLVSAERSRADRRERLISLTDAGWSLYRDMSPVMRERDRRLTADMSDSDLGIFLDALGRLEIAAANMARSEAEPDPD